MYLHATCVDYHGKGVLLVGSPGSGKSTLALAMIEAGASLVADDQIVIEKIEGALRASVVSGAEGVLEIPGFGIIRLENYVPHTMLAAVLELVKHPIDRMPEPLPPYELLGVNLPRWQANAADAHCGRKAIAFFSALLQGRLVTRLPVASAPKSA